MIEAPLAIQDQNLTIPQNHLDACAAQNIPVKGNAAGNTVDLFDLTGETLPPVPLPAGFTARGSNGCRYGTGEIKAQKETKTA
ncbi:MAG: hypothetical protein LQ340_002125 [Diploschistes diacapsis]|nr:MAG: hypothetical protein LQ340_002125 [Diploschistes diacapsis]